jgi:hypothetical protein
MNHWECLALNTIKHKLKFFAQNCRDVSRVLYCEICCRSHFLFHVCSSTIIYLQNTFMPKMPSSVRLRSRREVDIRLRRNSNELIRRRRSEIARMHNAMGVCAQLPVPVLQAIFERATCECARCRLYSCMLCLVRGLATLALTSRQMMRCVHEYVMSALFRRRCRQRMQTVSARHTRPCLVSTHYSRTLSLSKRTPLVACRLVYSLRWVR